VDATLEFQLQSPDMDGVIGNISSIPLVKNSTQVFSNSSILIHAVDAGRVVIVSELQSDPHLNLT